MTSSLEQGFTLGSRGRHKLVPHAGIMVSFDGEGFDWNNKQVSHAALEYQLALGSGVIEIAGGYAHERRLRSRFAVGHAFASAGYWAGWVGRRGGSGHGPLSSFPGHSWARAGNQAPAERGNVIGTVYMQQGITAASFSRASLVPFVEGGLTIDSAGQPWNNRRCSGKGCKLRVPMGAGTLEAAVLYKHEWRGIDGVSAGAPAAAINFWYGWNPVRRF